MRFLFRLDLSLHAGAGKKFEILVLVTKQGLRKVLNRWNIGKLPTEKKVKRLLATWIHNESG